MILWSSRLCRPELFWSELDLGVAQCADVDVSLSAFGGEWLVSAAWVRAASAAVWMAVGGGGALLLAVGAG
jgi:hypothetical protein